MDVNDENLSMSDEEINKYLAVGDISLENQIEKHREELLDRILQKWRKMQNDNNNTPRQD